MGACRGAKMARGSFSIIRRAEQWFKFEILGVNWFLFLCLSSQLLNPTEFFADIVVEHE